jgi:hypothetical protein
VPGWFRRVLRSPAVWAVIIAALLVPAVIVVTVLFDTNYVPPPPNKKLVDESMSRRPFWAPTKGAAMYLLGTGDFDEETWLLTAVGSSTEISFRQAAIVNIQLVAAESEPAAGQGYNVDGSNVVCVEVDASAFTITGPEEACTEPAHVPRRSWAWTLIPKEGISGPQVVAVSLSIEELEEMSRSSETVSLPRHHASRFLTIDVKKSLFERFLVPYMAALIGALGLLGAAAIGGLLKRSQGVSQD